MKKIIIGLLCFAMIGCSAPREAVSYSDFKDVQFYDLTFSVPSEWDIVWDINEGANSYSPEDGHKIQIRGMQRVSNAAGEPAIFYPDTYSEIVQSVVEQLGEQEKFTLSNSSAKKSGNLDYYYYDNDAETDEKGMVGYIIPLADKLINVRYEYPKAGEDYYKNAVEQMVLSVKIPDDISMAAAQAAKDLFESYSVSYDGSTEDGTVLDNNNSGIHVYRKDETGTDVELSGWTVKEPVTLKNGQTATATICIDDFELLLPVVGTQLTVESLKAMSQDIAYEDLARRPTDYEGQYLHVYGRVLQVLDNGDSVELRVATSAGEYDGWYDDIIYVVYKYKEGESRILEDDKVDFYGVYTGTISYTAVTGASITIPSMYAGAAEIE